MPNRSETMKVVRLTPDSDVPGRHQVVVDYGKRNNNSPPETSFTPSMPEVIMTSKYPSSINSPRNSY